MEKNTVYIYINPDNLTTAVYKKMQAVKKGRKITARTDLLGKSQTIDFFILHSDNLYNRFWASFPSSAAGAELTARRPLFLHNVSTLHRDMICNQSRMFRIYSRTNCRRQNHGR